MSSFYLRSSTSICRRFNLSAPCSNKYKISLPYSAPCTTQQSIKIGPCVKLIQMPSDSQQLHVSAGQNVESSFHLFDYFPFDCFRFGENQPPSHHFLVSVNCVFVTARGFDFFFLNNNLRRIHWPTQIKLFTLSDFLKKNTSTYWREIWILRNSILKLIFFSLTDFVCYSYKVRSLEGQNSGSNVNGSWSGAVGLLQRRVRRLNFNDIQRN